MNIPARRFQSGYSRWDTVYKPGVLKPCIAAGRSGIGIRAVHRFPDQCPTACIDDINSIASTDSGHDIVAGIQVLAYAIAVADIPTAVITAGENKRIDLFAAVFYCSHQRGREAQAKLIKLPAIGTGYLPQQGGCPLWSTHIQGVVAVTPSAHAKIDIGFIVKRWRCIDDAIVIIVGHKDDGGSIDAIAHLQAGNHISSAQRDICQPLCGIEPKHLGTGLRTRCAGIFYAMKYSIAGSQEQTNVWIALAIAINGAII